VTQYDHITITRNDLCACAVSKMIQIFEIPDLNLRIHYVTFKALL